MSKRINVNPDHYKTEGRLRPDEAASERFSRTIAAKPASQQRPVRAGKGLYFERPEPAPAKSARPAAEGRARKKSSSTARTKKTGSRKASAPRRTAMSRKAVPTRRTARPGFKKK